MKTTNILKEIGGLAFEDKTAIKSGSYDSGSQMRRLSDNVRRAAVQPEERAARFRESLRRRAVTPLATVNSYRHFGINE